MLFPVFVLDKSWLDGLVTHGYIPEIKCLTKLLIFWLLFWVVFLQSGGIESITSTTCLLITWIRMRIFNMPITNYYSCSCSWNGSMILSSLNTAVSISLKLLSTGTWCPTNHYGSSSLETLLLDISLLLSLSETMKEKESLREKSAWILLDTKLKLPEIIINQTLSGWCYLEVCNSKLNIISSHRFHSITSQKLPKLSKKHLLSMISKLKLIALCDSTW